MSFPFTMQKEANDCGPTCLKMLTDFYGGTVDTEFLKGQCSLTKAGASMLNLSKTAKRIGFESRGVKISIEQLKEIVQVLPVIFHYNRNHFVVIYRAPEPGLDGSFYLADPARGLITYDYVEFLRFWVGTGKRSGRDHSNNYTIGNCLLIQPTHVFYRNMKE